VTFGDLTQAGADPCWTTWKEAAMPSVADIVDAVIGGDTHSEFHQLEMTAPTGAVLATTTVANTTEGFTQARAWIAAHAPGARLMVGMEGTRSYGIGLSQALQAVGLRVVEVEQPSAKTRRGKGKSDRIDAHHASMWLLGRDPAMLGSPRADGDREALRILLVGYQQIVAGYVAQLNALRALLITGDDSDRVLARRPATMRWLAEITRRRPRNGDSREHAVRRAETRRLALACRDAQQQRRQFLHHLEQLADDLAPGVTAQRGVGPVTAAQLILGFSHPGRCRNEAAFANLAGVAPVEATSGKTGTRHRLNRGGDRHLNRALHDIVMTRMRCDPQTRDYVARRTAEGKTIKEIRRCLKRYLARQQYRYLTTAMT
jgi:transposase